MPGGQFQWLGIVGSCQVGNVWSAVDFDGRPLTVALLDPAVAGDPRWRQAFVTAAHNLAQQRGGFAFADFSVVGPWAAWLVDGRPGAESVFLALGQAYRPVAPTGPVPLGAATPGPAGPGPVAPGPGPAQPPARPAQPPARPAQPPARPAQTPAEPAQTQAGPAQPPAPGPMVPDAGVDRPVADSPGARSDDAGGGVAPGPAPSEPAASEPTPPSTMASAPVSPSATGPRFPGAVPEPTAARSNGAPLAGARPANEPLPDDGVTTEVNLTPQAGPWPLAPTAREHERYDQYEQLPPVGSPAAPTSAIPASGVPTSGVPISGAPTSGVPTSGAPTSAPVPAPRSPFAAGATVEPLPYDTPFTPEDWGTKPRITPSPPTPRRTGLRITIIAAVVVLLAGGGFVTWRQWGGHGGAGTHTPLADATTSAGPNASASNAPLPPLPTASPLHPGIEPPKPGSWPAAWPKFAASDNIRTFTSLDGLGFPVKAPPAWDCTPAARASGLAQYTCGTTGSVPQIGGELTMRTCAAPCDGGQQTEMRSAEEAWGLQWLRIGPAATYAESSSLQIDGAKRYGLVIVAYFRSGASGAIDRQLVLRMTAPVSGAGQLRRVANFLRDTLIF